MYSIHYARINILKIRLFFRALLLNSDEDICSIVLARATNVFSQVRIAGNPFESVGADVPEAIPTRIYRESKRGFVQEFYSNSNTREPSSRYVNRAAFRAIFRQPYRIEYEWASIRIRPTALSGIATISFGPAASLCHRYDCFDCPYEL